MFRAGEAEIPSHVFSKALFTSEDLKDMLAIDYVATSENDARLMSLVNSEVSEI